MLNNLKNKLRSLLSVFNRTNSGSSAASTSSPTDAINSTSVDGTAMGTEVDASTVEAAVTPDASSPNAVQRKQFLASGIVIGIIALAVCIAVYALSTTTKKPAKTRKAGTEETELTDTLKIEVASKVLDAEKMWRNHFEDKLSDSKRVIDEKLAVIEQSFVEKEQQLVQEAKSEAEAIKQQLLFAQEELRDAINELKLAREAQTARTPGNGEFEQQTPEVNMSSYILENEKHIALPKSSRSYIPETAYVQGMLVGGISVSTSMGAKTEPIPVMIRVTSCGNLPENFDIDVKTCNILGSAYGDLSSERAVIRVETMSCRDEATEQIVTTKIAGIVYGDDGMNGIKGNVIALNNKHIQSAFMGGLLGSFSSVAKAPEQMLLTGAGAVSTEPTTLKARALGAGISGIGNAGEKIADYYLKQAEAMSPVLQIAGGTKIDIVFTKGVYVGSSDVKDKIAAVRNVATTQMDGAR